MKLPKSSHIPIIRPATAIELSDASPCSLPVVGGAGFTMCRVWNAEGVECRALYGNSGAMGETESFFNPEQFKASDIVKWEPLEENAPAAN